MPRGKKELAEQIIPHAASVEVEVGRGKTVAEAVKKMGVTECLTRCSRPTVLFCAVAAAHQHDPGAQCLGLPAPGASMRGSPKRSHGVRLSKRTGRVYWRAKS